ncbi:NINE protein [Nocardioides antri]|uniref:NINE protein n=1 Tax=Nocardioides antri TaxID=2607659 RepID=A0A5B1M1Y2_9ACTN|nr:NINE protein [Nocardioides antri]KAA1426771.1 NINE protein [Nocardioides antri]
MTQPPVPPPPGGYGYGGSPVAGSGGPFYVSVLGQEQGPLDFNTLAQMAVSNQIKSDTPVRTADSQQYIAAKDVPGLYSDKEWLTVVLLSWLTGVFGVDRFYLGQTGLGVGKLLTCGGCGIWSLYDLIMFALRKQHDADGRPFR